MDISTTRTDANSKSNITRGITVATTEVDLEMMNSEEPTSNNVIDLDRMIDS